jgi:hypothetical protein
MINIKKQTGSVSLFVVIFATLLITVVTVGFIKIMVNDQKQASAANLAQSAYDSALAGVEDAKRAIVDYRTNPGAVNITNWGSTCNAVMDRLYDGASDASEIKIQNGSNVNLLNQSYTCVKVKLDTPDYLGVLVQDNYKIIPLKANGSFKYINIDWFSSADLMGVSEPELSSGFTLKNKSEWSVSTPPIMRAQVIDGGSGFKMSDFGYKTSNNKSLFLYPLSIGSNTADLDIDDNVNAIGSPKGVGCSSLATKGYACSTKITLKNEISARSELAFLRLGAIYNSAHYRVTLVNAAGNIVNFHEVQPEVDSTGRASDLFRRVASRVELGDVDFPYPEAAVNLSGNFCKTFMITNNAADYNAGDCDPNQTDSTGL